MTARRQKRHLTVPEYDLLGRMTVLFLLTLLSFFVVQSDALSAFFGIRSLLPDGFAPLPFLLLAVLCGMIYLRERPQLRKRKKRVPFPSYAQWGAGIALWILATAFSWWATHPSVALEKWWLGVTADHGNAGIAFFAAYLYASLLLPPLAAYAVLIFPVSFLRRHARLIDFGIVLLLAYLFASSAEVWYHERTAAAVMRLTAAVLGVLPGEIVVHPGRWEIGYGSYLAIVGPLCSGFTMFVLFTGMFFYERSRHDIQKPLLSALILCVGLAVLFAANILRIAGLVALGSLAPAFATTIMHDAGGGIILLAVGWLYLRLAMRGGKSGRRA